MPPIQLVVADLAGTTIDHGSRAPSGAFRELFRRFKIDATETEAREPMGLHKRDHIRQMLAGARLTQSFQRAYARDWDENDVEEMFVAFLPLQMSVLPDFGDMIPGATEAINLLRDTGIKFAATTGYNREMLDLVLQQCHDGGYIPDCAISAEEVSTGRPAPWMIFQAMEALGVYDVRKVLKIGDTISDIAAGKNAGCQTVGVCMSGNMLGLSAEELALLDSEEKSQRRQEAQAAMLNAGADTVIDSIADLPALIASMQTKEVQQLQR